MHGFDQNRALAVHGFPVLARRVSGIFHSHKRPKFENSRFQYPQIFMISPGDNPFDESDQMPFYIQREDPNVSSSAKRRSHRSEIRFSQAMEGEPKLSDNLS